MSDPPKDGPKRIQTEPTIAIDREKLPPRDKAAIALAAQSYPDVTLLDLDEPDDVALAQLTGDELAAALRARRKNDPTLVPCPRCGRCAGCENARMVTVERAADIRAEDEEKHR